MLLGLCIICGILCGMFLLFGLYDLVFDFYNSPPLSNLGFLALGLCMSIYFGNRLSDQYELERAQRSSVAEAEWRAASCPVYKWECGSKSKYACEIKAKAIGPITIGDVVVQAYATCVKP